METGIELIAKERQEQIEKHGRTVIQDFNFNKNNQLLQAAVTLILPVETTSMEAACPKNWDTAIWKKMIRKNYKERLIIAAALIAAEIDCIQLNQNQTKG